MNADVAGWSEACAAYQLSCRIPQNTAARVSDGVFVTHKHRETRENHQIKRPMNDTHVGPVVEREFLHAGDLGARVIGKQQTQAVRNRERVAGRVCRIVGNPTNEQRRSLLRPIMRFHRGELGRLEATHGAGAQVAACDLQRDTDATDGQRQAQRAAMEKTARISQQQERMHMVVPGGEHPMEGLGALCHTHRSLITARPGRRKQLAH